MRLAEGLQEARISELEAKVLQLQARLERLEEGGVPRAPSDDREDHESYVVESQEADYWIGAKLVPRVGAVLVILSIAVFAFLEAAQSSGTTRALLLLAEAGLCLAFIGIGEWKRDELEGFGQTLSAIGSCGLYLTAAGGHFAYHALSEAQMAAVFAGITLFNHGYAVWRNTRLFFLIGAAGGMAAMLFPLSQKDYATALAVYVAVTVAGAAACAIRKWLQLAIVGWFFGLAILLPVIDSSQSRIEVIVAMYLGSLACIAASAWAYGLQKLDTLALGPPVALAITGAVGLAVISGPPAVTHLFVLALCGAGIAFVLPKDDPAKRSLYVGAAATLFVLGPFAFSPVIGVFLFAGLAWGAAMLSRYAIPRLAALFAIVEAFLGAVSYGRALLAPEAVHESLLLGAVAAGVPAFCFAFRNARWEWLNLGIASTWAVLARWAIVLSPSMEGQALWSLLTAVLVAYAMLLLALGFRFHCATLRLWSFGVMTATVFQVLSLGNTVSTSFKVGALLAVGLMMLSGGYRYVHDRRIPH